MQESSPCTPRSGGRRTVLLSGLFVFLVGVCVWLLAMAIWEANTWNDLKMEEIVNQLATPMEGTGGFMIEGYLLVCVLPALLAMIAAGVFLFRFRGRPQYGTVIRRGSLIGTLFTAAMLVYAFFLLDVGNYLIEANTDSDYIEKNYVDPRQVELTFPQQKRNLIYIWLESMESTYTDQASGGAFSQNVIPELTRLAEENVTFTGPEGGVNGGCSMFGATWTAGALFAQTSGLPLKIPIADSSMDHQDFFFPGIVTLGDILADNGYQQALLIGSDATFGGRRLYFTEHGGYQMWDYNYSLETGQIPEDYFVWWGYEDEKLFSFAREHLTEMAASGQPFNLSLLTVDTHFSNGYVCRLCGDEYGDDQYSNVMACSSRQVTEFVKWIQRQPFYENTTIVISGDHVTMDADYCDDVPEEYQRRVYATIINPAAQLEYPERRRDYTTFDQFPTTLAALGVDIPGDRLGLGVNLFSGRQTLLERDGFEKMNTELKRRSAFIDSLSGIDANIYALSSALSGTDTGLEVDFGEDSLTYTVHGLSGLEDHFTQLEVFADLMTGDTRTTLWYQPAQRQPDGSYVQTMPLSELEGNQTFTVHIYAMTEAGRIRVDAGYLCDVSAQTLTREELDVASEPED